VRGDSTIPIAKDDHALDTDNVAARAVDTPAVAFNSSAINKPLVDVAPEVLLRCVVEAFLVRVVAPPVPQAYMLITKSFAYVVVTVFGVIVVPVPEVTAGTTSTPLAPRYATITDLAAVDVIVNEKDDASVSPGAKNL
jgi:hypothetical protein